MREAFLTTRLSRGEALDGEPPQDELLQAGAIIISIAGVQL